MNKLLVKYVMLKGNGSNFEWISEWIKRGDY